MPIAFYILGCFTLAGAALAITLRSLVHSVLAVALAFVGIALLFVALGAEFVGFAQVLVYVGAVSILVVFAIMLTRSADASHRPTFAKNWYLGILVAAAVFAALAKLIMSSSLTAAPASAAISVQQIGDSLLHEFSVPLEIMGLLLTAALIGGVVLAMPRKGEKG